MIWESTHFENPFIGHVVPKLIQYDIDSPIPNNHLNKTTNEPYTHDSSPINDSNSIPGLDSNESSTLFDQ